MVARKLRIAVVLDTNVFVRSFKSRSRGSPNKRVVRLWLLERQLQLVVSRDLIAEYLGVFHDVLGMDDESTAAWRDRFVGDRRATVVRLGRRFTHSRDPDDNLLLAIAAVGNAEYLITNDLDLLELPDNVQRNLPFAIVTPKHFLESFGSS
jgi:putative PIN family toxin of toxin-antitoxin system